MARYSKFLPQPTLPSGASPGLLDWATLLRRALGRVETAQDGPQLLETRGGSGSDSVSQQQGQGASMEATPGLGPTPTPGPTATPSQSCSPSALEAATMALRNSLLAGSISSSSGGSAQFSGLHQVCCIDNDATDTQASVWADLRFVISY